MTEWHPLDSYYLWSQEPESIKQHCIYSESHLTQLAAGRSGSFMHMAYVDILSGVNVI